MQLFHRSIISRLTAELKRNIKITYVLPKTKITDINSFFD